MRGIKNYKYLNQIPIYKNQKNGIIIAKNF